MLDNFLESGVRAVNKRSEKKPSLLRGLHSIAWKHTIKSLSK